LKRKNKEEREYYFIGILFKDSSRNVKFIYIAMIITLKLIEIGNSNTVLNSREDDTGKTHGSQKSNNRSIWSACESRSHKPNT